MKPFNGHSFVTYSGVPTEIFNHALTPSYRKELFTSVMQARSTRAPIGEATLRRLRWYSDLAAGLVAEDVMSANALKVLGSDPFLGFGILFAEQRLYPKLAALEDVLIRDPETSERILAYVAAHGLTLNRPEAHYLESVSRDPSRLLRHRIREAVARLDVGNATAAKTKLEEQVAHEATRRRNESASWAYLFLKSHRTLTLDSGLVDALTEEDEYLYLAAAKLRGYQTPAENYRQLLLNIRSPRWAFHALRDKQDGDHEATRAHLVGVLTQSPAWSVQFWVHTGLVGQLPRSLDQLNALFYACMTQASEHDCLVELRAWHRCVTTPGSAAWQDALYPVVA